MSFPETQSPPRSRVPEVTPVDELVPTAALALEWGFTSAGLMAMVRRTGCLPIVRIGRRAMFRRRGIQRVIDQSIEPRPWRRVFPKTDAR